MIIKTAFIEIEVIEQMASDNWSIRNLITGELAEISNELLILLMDEQEIYQLIN